MQAHKVSHAQVLPRLLDPRRPVVLVAADPRDVRHRDVQVPARLLLRVRPPGDIRRPTVRLCLLGIVGVVIALLAQVPLRQWRLVRHPARRVGARPPRPAVLALGRPVLGPRRARPCARALLARTLERAPARRDARSLDVAVRGLLLLLLLGAVLHGGGGSAALARAGSHDALAPEALLAAVLGLFARLEGRLLLGLADELPPVEPVADEARHAEAAALLEREVGVVVRAAEGEDLDVVNRAVRLVALEVLVAVLERRDEKDDDEREGRQSRVDGREAREELEDDEDEEEDVGDAAELLEEVAREERDNVVLAREHLVRVERPPGGRDVLGAQAALLGADHLAVAVFDLLGPQRKLGTGRLGLSGDGDADEDLARVRVLALRVEGVEEAEVGHFGEPPREGVLRPAPRDRCRWHGGSRRAQLFKKGDRK